MFVALLATGDFYRKPAHIQVPALMICVLFVLMMGKTPAIWVKELRDIPWQRRVLPVNQRVTAESIAHDAVIVGTL